MSKEPMQIAAPITIPVFVPSDDIVNTAELPEHLKYLTDTGYMTTEEAVGFLQFNMVMSQIASSVPEFLQIFRAVKEELDKQQSGIIVPETPRIILPS